MAATANFQSILGFAVVVVIIDSVKESNQKSCTNSQ